MRLQRKDDPDALQGVYGVFPSQIRLLSETSVFIARSTLHRVLSGYGVDADDRGKELPEMVSAYAMSREEKNVVLRLYACLTGRELQAAG